MTTFVTGAVNTTGAVNLWNPVNSQTGVGVTSVAYTPSVAFTVQVRSNATNAMSDTLPNPLLPSSDGSENVVIQNGWNFYIKNVDASASITLTPTVPATINGTTSLTITAGSIKKIWSDGINYWA